MIKLCKLTECKQVAVKHLRFLGLSFAEIRKQIGCSKSTAFNVFQYLIPLDLQRNGSEVIDPKELRSKGSGLRARLQES